MVNADSITLPINDIREKMISIGMSTNLVENLPDHIVEKYSNVTSENIITSYYKIVEAESDLLMTTNCEINENILVVPITEEECMMAIANNNIQPMGTIKESYLKLNTIASPVSGRRYVVSVSYEWLNPPFFNLTDYLALTIHETLVIIPDSEYSHTQYYETDGTIGSFTLIENNNAIVQSGLAGHCMAVQLVPSMGSITAFSFEGYLGYEVEIAMVGDSNTVSSIVYATYAHQTLIPSLGFSIDLALNTHASITPRVSFDYMYDTYNFTYNGD